MSLADVLRREIERDGPMPVSRWMERCNTQYYATRDPLGAAGDFTTAPEISQVFGELAGACLADLWLRAGSPEVRLVELGPGRGTLMADLLRAGKRAGFAPPVHFVETSPVLRAAQATRVPGAQWHDSFADVPDDGPLLLVANEFFDALPVRQFERGADGWRERCVGLDDDRFAPVAGRPVPPPLSSGDVIETSPASTAIAAEIGHRLRVHGGAALVIDYGYAGRASGDTLQAVRRHGFVDPFADPGEADLTAHVDFSALAAAAGVTAYGPVGQGAWLRALGIEPRAAALKARATPAQQDDIDAATARLTEGAAMGDLFKVMALTGPGWPVPAGFAA